MDPSKYCELYQFCNKNNAFFNVTRMQNQLKSIKKRHARWNATFSFQKKHLDVRGWLQKLPKCSQDTPKTASWPPKTPPRRPQDASKTPSDALSRASLLPRSPGMRFGRPRGALGEPPEGPSLDFGWILNRCWEGKWKQVGSKMMSEPKT